MRVEQSFVRNLGGLMPARSKNSCSFLIVVFEQGSRPFPESNGHVT